MSSSQMSSECIIVQVAFSVCIEAAGRCVCGHLARWFSLVLVVPTVGFRLVYVLLPAIVVVTICNYLQIVSVGTVNGITRFIVEWGPEHCPGRRRGDPASWTCGCAGCVYGRVFFPYTECVRCITMHSGALWGQGYL